MKETKILAFMGFETVAQWHYGCKIKEAMILAVMKAIYAIAYIEACKKSALEQGLNVWPCNTSATL